MRRSVNTGRLVPNPFLIPALAAMVGLAGFGSAQAEKPISDPEGISFGRSTDPQLVSRAAAVGDEWGGQRSLSVSDAYGDSGTVLTDSGDDGTPYVQPETFDTLAAESYESAAPSSLLPQYDALGRRATYRIAPDNSLIRDVGAEPGASSTASDETPAELARYATEGTGAAIARPNGFGFNLVSASDPGPSGTPGFVQSLLLISPTPEPATWWTMIAGFGLTGAALRRSNRAVRRAQPTT